MKFGLSLGASPLTIQTIFVLFYMCGFWVKLSIVHQAYYKILIVLFNFAPPHEYFVVKFIRKYFIYMECEKMKFKLWRVQEVTDQNMVSWALRA